MIYYLMMTPWRGNPISARTGRTRNGSLRPDLAQMDCMNSMVENSWLARLPLRLVAAFTSSWPRLRLRASRRDKVLSFASALLVASMLAPIASAFESDIAGAGCADQARPAVCERKDKGTPKGNPAGAQQQRTLLQGQFAGLAPQQKG